MADIDVYNLDSRSSSNEVYEMSSSDTGTTIDEAEGGATPTSYLTEDDVVDLINDVFNGYNGRLVIGSEASNQAFIADTNGIYLGGSNFSTATFSVDMDGNLVATSATITGTITATSGEIGGWTINATSIADSSTATVANVLIDSANTLIRLGPTSGTYITLDGANQRIRSSNYVSGVLGSGFTLDPNLLEVGNISARGSFKAATFEYQTISATAGSQLILKSADKLATDMTALDASTLTVEGNVIFANGDVLRIREGSDDEWMTITDASSAPTYVVDRDEAGSYSPDSNPAWTKGAAVLNYGQSGDGGIYMTADDTNAPYVSIFSHAGSPWSSVTNHLRLGNLNGFLDYSSDLFGIGIGTSSSFMSYDTTNDLRIRGRQTNVLTQTAGWDITSGELVSIESDGKIYPTRISDLGLTVDTATVASTNRGNEASNFIKLSNTLAFFTYRNTLGGHVARRVIYSIEDGSEVVSSIATASITTSGDYRPIIKKISETSALFVGFNDADTAYAQVLTSLDSGVTSNTQYTVDSDMDRSPRPYDIAKVSSSQFLIAYTDGTSFDIKMRVLDVSGTVVTVGSEQSILASTVDEILGFIRFGTSEYYGIIYEDTADSQYKVVVIQWDGSTLTVGSSANINTTARGVISAVSLTDTKLGYAFQDQTGVEVGVISRSSTTPTDEGSAEIVSTTAQDGDVFCFAVGEDTYGVIYPNTSTTDMDAQLLRVEGTTITALGSKVDLGTVDTVPEGYAVGGLVVSPKHIIFQYDDTDDTAEMFAPTNNYASYIGISAATISKNSSGSVVLGGYSDDVSGLTVAEVEYVGIDGAIVNGANGGLDRIGVALSSTEIKLDQQ